MSDRIAEKDIVEVNDAGQRVVVVAKGQPIPEGVAVKKVDKPVENKARKVKEKKA